MKMNKSIIYPFLGLFILFGACNKDAFLNKKPNTGLIVPSSLVDLRSMLDNTTIFIWSPGIGEISADNYYMNYSNWQAESEVIRNAYSWQKNIMKN